MQAELDTGTIRFSLAAYPPARIDLEVTGEPGAISMDTTEARLTLSVKAADQSTGILTVSGLALKAVLDAIKANPALAAQVSNSPEPVANEPTIFTGEAYILAESTSQAVYEADAMVGWTKVGPGRGWRTADGYHVAILTSPHLLRGFPSTGRLYLGSGWDRSEAFVNQGSPYELARARGLEVWMVAPNSRAILVPVTTGGA